MQPRSIQETYWDIEAASERLSAFWHMELVQTAPGALHLNFGLATVGRCAVYQCSTNVELVATGARADKILTISPITSECAASR